MDLKAKASGDLLYLNAATGQKVKKGQLIASLDSSEALRTLRDAQNNLETANLSLDKLNQPPDDLALLQAQNSLEQAKQAKQNAENNIIKGYEDSFNDLSNTFLDLPDIMNGLFNILYSNEIGKTEVSVNGMVNTSALLASTYESQKQSIAQFQEKAKNDYQAAELEYSSNFQSFKNSNRDSSQKTIEDLLEQTIITLKKVSQSANSESNYLSAWLDARSKAGQKTFTQVTTYQNNLASYIGQLNSHISSLLSQQKNLQDNFNAIINTDMSIAEKTQTLEKLQAGPDSLDVRSQQLSIQQKEDALNDARQKLADYSIYAPFDGTIAKVNVKKGDSLSSGTVVATLISPKHIADISLNEIDAAKVKVGQKATLTFDAIESLTLTGEVFVIDSIGAVSQGVVSYNLQIAIDTQDSQIKPGMSVNANIIIDSKIDILAVPNSALKTQGAISYVEILDDNAVSSADGQSVTSPTAPKQQIVQIGLTDDNYTEIISGLKEGDKIIIKTNTSTASKTTAQTAPSLFGATGGNNAFRTTTGR